MRSSSGQALIEFALVVPLFAIFLAGLILFSRVFIARLFLMRVVKEGYLMMVYADASDHEIWRKFGQKMPVGLRDLKIDVEKHSRSLWRPDVLRAEAQLPISGLSRTILGKNSLTMEAQLSGYVGTWRGAGPLAAKIWSKFSPLEKR